MLIVLEGVDGAGKTFLANTLALMLDARIIHHSKPQTFSDYATVIEQSKSENIIADRFFWGQFVYQRPEERLLSEVSLLQLEAMLHDTKGKLVYVHAPLDVIQHRLNARNERTALPLQRLMELYDHRVDCCTCPVIKYDSFNGEVELWP